MTTAITKVDSSDALMTDGQLDPSKVLAVCTGVDASDFEFAPLAPTHRWEPEARTAIVGTVVGTFVYENTEYGAFTNYLVQLAQPAVGVNNATDEAEQLQPGDTIAVAARTTADAQLKDKVGQLVGIVCVGKFPSKKVGQSYWLYAVGTPKAK